MSDIVSQHSEKSTYQPLITVITVVYNGYTSLEKTILSVINQTYLNIQYVVIDGGSTDGTVDILHRYSSKINYWVSEPDKGVYDAMNKGLDQAAGKWVYFLGAGDVLLDILEKVAPQLTDEYIIYYGDVYRKDTLTTYDGEFSPFKLAVLNICHQAILYPSSVFKKHRYNLKYKIQADHALNLECFGDKDYRFKYLPVIICVYEGDGYSAVNNDLPFFADKIKIIKSNFPFIVYCYALARRKVARLFKPAYS